MVTFEIFARAALELLGGQEEMALHMPLARLTREFRHRIGLTRFLPARLSADGARGHAGGLARLGRYSRADARQRLSGGRSRPRRVCARRMDPGAR